MNHATTIGPQKLLVVGGPASGKTTYRTQLYQRVEHGDGDLQLVSSVSDMAALDGDVERLVHGLQPMHTNHDIYHSTEFTVEKRDKTRFSLEFADYGGEQIRQIGETNFIPFEWVKRARQSTCWLLFLRIDIVRPLKSFMVEPVHIALHPKADEDLPTAERSTELMAIDTLQRLIFVRGASLRYPLQQPRLAVLLSCWDELPEAERSFTPWSVLEKRAPLFSQFVAANWKINECKVWGLSSTERKLSEEVPDLEFARRGPECVGYVVLGDGSTSSDLTQPVSWLMETV